MIELKLDLAAAMTTPAAVTHPHELLDVIFDHIAPARLRLRRNPHRDHCLSAFNAALLALILGHEQGMDLVCLKVVVVPMKAILEMPIRTIPIRATTTGYRRCVSMR